MKKKEEEGTKISFLEEGISFSSSLMAQWVWLTCAQEEEEISFSSSSVTMK